MASGGQWDAEKMLDVYIHDYLVKKNMHKVAEAFAKEANVGNDTAVIDEPHGFLTDWWTIFWDVYSSRRTTHPEAMPTQAMENEQRNIRPTMPKPEMNQQMGRQLLGQPAANLLASKIYEEERSRLPARDFNPNLRLLDVDKLNLSKASSSCASHSLQQIPQMSQHRNERDKSRGVSLGRTNPMDSTLYGVPKAILPRAGLQGAGMQKGANMLPIKGWPLTGVDQIPPKMAYPVLNSLLPVPNQQQQQQLQTSMSHHQQDLLSQVMAKTPGKQISPFEGSTDNLCNLMLPRNDLSGTGGLTMAPRRQTAGQQMLLPKIETVEQQTMVRMRQPEEQKMMVPMRRIAEQQHKDQQTQRQFHENSRKRKNSSHSQTDENALEGRDVEEKKPSDDIESFLSHDDNAADIMSSSFSNLQRRSTVHSISEQNGFSFEEVGSLHASKDRMLCCHFSSDGKLLASAGHEKKVLLWSMSSFDFVHTAEGHSDLITDVRFRPSSSVFATSSFDRTVQIWDANKPSKSPFKLLGHAEQVTSLDFHPRKLDHLCSCDSNDEIRLWNINQHACTQVFKGATRQVRFQPQVGSLLAAASGKGINLFDSETNSLQFCLEGHDKEVRSICWDTSGKYIASVSEDSARLWSVVSGGKCIHELHSSGHKFESCTFHHAYSQLLVIGSYQSIDLWNPTESNKIVTIAAHNGIITGLADSPETELNASASHDRCVKLWR